MSDATPTGTAPPRSDAARPGPVHEELWNRIRDMVEEMVAEFAPTMGEVTGMNGGAVNVRIDGEEDDREVPIARKRGQSYRKGDRVKITRLRDGALMADGTVGTKAGKDGAIGSDDYEEDSVDRTALGPKSVGKDQIDAGAVQRGNITNKAIGKDELDTNAVQRANIAPKAVGKDELDTGAVDTPALAQKSVTADKLADNAKTDLSDYVKSSALAPGATGNSKLATESDLGGYLKNGDVRSEAKGSKELATQEWVTQQINKIKDKGGGNE